MSVHLSVCLFEREKRYEGNMIVLADNDDTRLKFLKRSRIHEHPILYTRSVGLLYQ